MHEIMVFESAAFGQIRTVEQGGQTWFVAADVCRTLEIQNATQAVGRLDEDERAMLNIGRQGETNVVNESGLYTLVLSSRKPEAKAFRRWITHEVLPSIRKRGLYATESTVDHILNNPDFGIRLLEELKQEREEKRLLEAKVQEDAPRVRFAQAVEDTDGDILIGELAKILKQAGVDTGEKRLFETLRRDGYLISSGAERNLPTQKSMELRIMRVVKRTVTLPDGRQEVRNTPKITGKGQIYFLKRYGARGERA